MSASAVVTTGFARQLRIVSALMIREMRLRRSKSGLMMAFDLLEAVGFIMFNYMLASMMGRKLLIGDSLLVFIATGVLPILFFRSMTMRAQSGIEAARTVTFIPYIQPLDYAVARMTVEFISFVLLYSFFFAMIHTMDISRYALPFDVAKLAEFLVLVALFGFGVGLLNSFITYLFPPWKIIWSIFSRLQIFMAGVFFIPEYMPEPLRTYVAINPLMHFVALFRTAFYPTYPTFLLSMNYMLIWTAACIVFGLAMERALRNQRAH